MDAAACCRSVAALAASAAVLAGGAACGDTSAAGDRAGRPRIVLVEAGHPGRSAKVEIVGPPAADPAAVRSASFERVYPTGAVLPENQLRRPSSP